MVNLCKGFCLFILQYQRSKHCRRAALVFTICFISTIVISKFGPMNRSKTDREKDMAQRSKMNGINEKYDHCLWVNLSGGSDILIADDSHLLKTPVANMTCLYKRYVTTLQVLCRNPKRFGDVGFGGFRLCSDYDVTPKLGCTILTNHLNISKRFIKQTREMYNCSVIFHKNNQISGFSDVEISLNIIRNQISVLILQLTQNDLRYLPELAKCISAKRIKQLVVEIDNSNFNHTEIMFLLQFFRHLYLTSYRVYWFDRSFEFISKGRSIRLTVNLYLSTTANDLDAKPTTKNEINDLPNVEHVGQGHLERIQKIEYHDIATRYLSRHQILCREIVRLGKSTEGGWEVCHDIRFRPKSPCIVYSFGIGSDFTFEEDMAATFGCDVYSFDPLVENYRYLHKENVKFFDIGKSEKDATFIVRNFTEKHMTMQSILKKFGHLRKRIDVLKIDVQNNSILNLTAMIKSKVLKNVSQLYVEFHNFYDVGALRKLYDIGFRIFWSRQNPQRATYMRNETFSPVMDLHFVNMNI